MFSLRISKFTIPDLQSATLTATSPSFTSIAAYRGADADAAGDGAHNNNGLLTVDLYRSRGLLKPFSRAENVTSKASGASAAGSGAATSPSPKRANASKKGTHDGGSPSAAAMSAAAFVDDWTRYEHIRVNLGLSAMQCSNIDRVEGTTDASDDDAASSYTYGYEQQLSIVAMHWLSDTLLVAYCRNRTGTYSSVKIVAISPNASSTAVGRLPAVDPLLTTVYTANGDHNHNNDGDVDAEELLDAVHENDPNRRPWTSAERIIVTTVPAPLMEHLLNRTPANTQTPIAYTTAIYQQSSLYRARLEGRSHAEDIFASTDSGSAASTIDALVVGQRIQGGIWSVTLDGSARGAIWVQMDNMVGCVTIADLVAARTLDEESRIVDAHIAHNNHRGDAGCDDEPSSLTSIVGGVAAPAAPLAMQVLYRVPINTNMVVQYLLEWDAKVQETAREMGADDGGASSFATVQRRLESDLLIAFQYLPMPLWAAASRYVCVYDDEYSELKIWALQASNAVICVANLPMRLPLANIGAGADGAGANGGGGNGAANGPTHPLMSTYTQLLSSSTSLEDEMGSGNSLNNRAATPARIPAGRLDAIRQLRLSCPLPPMHTLRLSDDASTVFIMYYRESADHIVTNANRFLAAVANTSIALQNEGTLAEKAAVIRRRAVSMINTTSEEATRLEVLMRLEGSKRLDVYLQLLDLERVLRSQSAAALAERGTATGSTTYGASAPAAPIVLANSHGFSAAALAVTAVDFTRVFCGDELRIESSISLPWGAIERASQEKVDLYSKKFLVPIDDVPTPADLLAARGSVDHSRGGGSVTEEPLIANDSSINRGGEAFLRSANATPVNNNRVVSSTASVAAWNGFLAQPDSPLLVTVQHVAIVDNTVVLFMSTGVVFAVSHTGETSMHDVSHWRPETLGDEEEGDGDASNPLKGGGESITNADGSTADANDTAAIAALTGPCVWLRCPRPPLPAFVTSLLLREEGCYAYFSSPQGQINKDALLRNEINHGGASTAVTMCQLNNWSAAEIQETTLQLAVSESAEAVYHVVSLAFKGDCRRRRQQSGTLNANPASPIRAFAAAANANTAATASAASPTGRGVNASFATAASLTASPEMRGVPSPLSANGSMAGGSSAKIDAASAAAAGGGGGGGVVHVEELLANLVYTPDTERPTDTLHLLTRLCNMVCIRFDNCPDEPAARRTLKNLIATCVSMLSVVGRYCAEFADDTILAYRTYASEYQRMADQNEDSYLSKLVREAAPLVLPFAPADEAQRKRYFNNAAVANDDSMPPISTDRLQLFNQLAYNPLVATEDTYMLLALRQGMLEMRAAVRDQQQIYGITSDSINWSSRPKGMIALSDGVVVATGGDTNSSLVMGHGASSYAPPTIGYSASNGLKQLLEGCSNANSNNVATTTAMAVKSPLMAPPRTPLGGGFGGNAMASLAGSFLGNVSASTALPPPMMMGSSTSIHHHGNNSTSGSGGLLVAAANGFTALSNTEVPEALRVDWLRLTDTLMDVLTASIGADASSSSSSSSAVTNALLFMNMVLPSLSHTLLTLLDFCCFPASGTGEELSAAFAAADGSSAVPSANSRHHHHNHTNSDGQPIEYFRRCAGLAVSGESQEAAALRNDKKSPFLLRHLQFLVSFIVYERLLKAASSASSSYASVSSQQQQGGDRPLSFSAVEGEFSPAAYSSSSAAAANGGNRSARVMMRGSPFSPAAVAMAKQCRMLMGVVFGKRLAALWWALLERKTVITALSNLMREARTADKKKKNKSNKKAADNAADSATSAAADKSIEEAHALMANFEAVASDLEAMYLTQGAAAAGLGGLYSSNPNSTAIDGGDLNATLDDGQRSVASTSATNAAPYGALHSHQLSYVDYSSYASAFIKASAWMSLVEQRSQEAVKQLMASTNNSNSNANTNSSAPSTFNTPTTGNNGSSVLAKAFGSSEVQRSILAWAMSVQHKQPFLNAQPQYNEGLYGHVLLRTANGDAAAIGGSSSNMNTAAASMIIGGDAGDATASGGSTPRRLSTTGTDGFLEGTRSFNFNATFRTAAAAGSAKGTTVLDGASIDVVFNMLLGGLGSPFTDYTETPPNEPDYDGGGGANGHYGAMSASNGVASGSNGMSSHSHNVPLPLGQSGRKLVMPVCPRNLPFHSSYRPRQVLASSSSLGNASSAASSSQHHHVENWRSLQHNFLFAADDATATVQRLSWLGSQVERQRNAKVLNVSIDTGASKGGQSTAAGSSAINNRGGGGGVRSAARNGALTVSTAANSRESEINASTLTTTSQLLTAALKHGTVPISRGGNTSSNNRNSYSAASVSTEVIDGAFAPAFTSTPLMLTADTHLTVAAPFALPHAIEDLSQGLLDVLTVGGDEDANDKETAEEGAVEGSGALQQRPLFAWYVALVERLFLAWTVEGAAPFTAAPVTVNADGSVDDASVAVVPPLWGRTTAALETLLGLPTSSSPTPSPLYVPLSDVPLFVAALAEFRIRRVDADGFFAWCARIMVRGDAATTSASMTRQMLTALLAFAVPSSSPATAAADANEIAFIRKQVATTALFGFVALLLRIDEGADVDGSAAAPHLLLLESLVLDNNISRAEAALVWEAILCAPRTRSVKTVTARMVSTALKGTAAAADDGMANSAASSASASSVVLDGLSPIQLLWIIRANGSAATIESLIEAAARASHRQLAKKEGGLLPPATLDLFKRYSLYLPAIGAALRVFDGKKGVTSSEAEATFVFLSMLHQQRLFSSSNSNDVGAMAAVNVTGREPLARLGALVAESLISRCSIPSSGSASVASVVGCAASSSSSSLAALRVAYVVRLVADSSTTAELLLRVGKPLVRVLEGAAAAVASSASTNQQKDTLFFWLPFAGALRNRMILAIKQLIAAQKKQLVSATSSDALATSAVADLRKCIVALSNVLLVPCTAAAAATSSASDDDHVSEVIHRCFNGLFPTTAGKAKSSSSATGPHKQIGGGGPAYTFALRPSADEVDGGGADAGIGSALSPATATWFLGLSGQKLAAEKARLAAVAARKGPSGGGIASYTDKELSVEGAPIAEDGSAAGLLKAMRQWRATGRVVSVKGEGGKKSSSPSAEVSPSLITADSVAIVNLLDDLRPFSAFYYTKSLLGEELFADDGADSSIVAAAATAAVYERLTVAARSYGLGRAHRPSALACAHMYLELLESLARRAPSLGGADGAAEGSNNGSAAVCGEGTRLLVDAAVVRILCAVMTHNPTILSSASSSSSPATSGISVDAIVSAMSQLCFVKKGGAHSSASTQQRHLKTLLMALNAIHAAAMAHTEAKGGSLGDDVNDLVAESHHMLRTFTVKGATQPSASVADATARLFGGDDEWDVAPWLALGGNSNTTQCPKECVGTALSDIIVRFAANYADELGDLCVGIVQRYFSVRWLGASASSSSSSSSAGGGAWMTALFQAWALNVPPQLLLPNTKAVTAAVDGDEAKAVVVAPATAITSAWQLPILHALRRLAVGDANHGKDKGGTSSPLTLLAIPLLDAEAVQYAELTRCIEGIVESTLIVAGGGSGDASASSPSCVPTAIALPSSPEALFVFKAIPLVSAMCGADFAAGLRSLVVAKQQQTAGVDDDDADARVAYASAVIAVVAMSAAKRLRAREVRALLLRIDGAVDTLCDEEDATAEGSAESLPLQGSLLLDSLVSLLATMAKATTTISSSSPSSPSTASIVTLQLLQHILRLVKSTDDNNYELTMAESKALGAETLFTSALMQLPSAVAQQHHDDSSSSAFTTAARLYLALNEAIARSAYNVMCGEGYSLDDADYLFGDVDVAGNTAAAVTNLSLAALVGVLGESAASPAARMNLALPWQLVAKCAATVEASVTAVSSSSSPSATQLCPSRESVTLAASLLSMPQCALAAFGPFTTSAASPSAETLSEPFSPNTTSSPHIDADRSLQMKLVRLAVADAQQQFVELSMAVLPSNATLRRTIRLLEQNGVLGSGGGGVGVDGCERDSSSPSQSSGGHASAPSSFSMRFTSKGSMFGGGASVAGGGGGMGSPSRERDSGPTNLKPLTETEKSQRRHMWSLVAQRVLHRQLGRETSSASSAIGMSSAGPSAVNEHTDGEYLLSGRLGGHYLLLPRALQAATALIQSLLSPSAPIANSNVAGSFLDDSARAARGLNKNSGGGMQSHPAFSIPDFGPWRTIAEAFAVYIADSNTIERSILERQQESTTAANTNEDGTTNTNGTAARSSAFMAAIADSILVLSEARHSVDSGLEMCGMFHSDAERTEVLDDLVEEVMEEVGKFEDEAQMEVVRLLAHEAFAREVVTMTLGIETPAPDAAKEGNPSSSSASASAAHSPQQQQQAEHWWWLSPAVVRWCLAKVVAHSDTIAKQEGDAIKTFAAFADELVTAIEAARQEKLDTLRKGIIVGASNNEATRQLERYVGSLLARVLSTLYLTLYSADCQRDVHELCAMAKASLAITNSSPVLPSPRGSTSSATSRFTRKSVSFRSKASTVPHNTGSAAAASAPAPSSAAPYDPIAEALAKAREQQLIDQQAAFQQSLMQHDAATNAADDDLDGDDADEDNQRGGGAVGRTASSSAAIPIKRSAAANDADGDEMAGSVNVAGLGGTSVKKKIVVIKKVKKVAKDANNTTDAVADVEPAVPEPAPVEEDASALLGAAGGDETVPGSVKKKVVIKKVVKKVAKKVGAATNAEGGAEGALTDEVAIAEITPALAPQQQPAGVVPIWAQTATTAEAVSPRRQVDSSSPRAAVKKVAIPSTAAKDLLEATGSRFFANVGPSATAASAATVSPIVVKGLQQDTFLCGVLSRQLAIPRPTPGMTPEELATQLAPWQWARQLMGADRYWVRSVWDDKVTQSITSSSGHGAMGGGNGAADGSAAVDYKAAVRERRIARRHAQALLRQQALQLQQQQAMALAQLANTTQMSEEMMGQFMSMMQASNNATGYNNGAGGGKANAASPTAAGPAAAGADEDGDNGSSSLLTADPEFDDWCSDDCSSDEDAELAESGLMVVRDVAASSPQFSPSRAGARAKKASNSANAARDPFASDPELPYRSMSARAYYRDIKLPSFFAHADATQVWETSVRMLLEMTKKMRKRQRAEREAANKAAAAGAASMDPLAYGSGDVQLKKKRDAEAAAELAMVQQLMRSTIATILTFPNHKLVDVLPEVTRLLDVGTNEMLRRCRVKVPNPNRHLDFATAHAYPVGDKLRPLSVEVRETMLADTEGKIVSQVPLLKATMMLSRDPEEILGPCTSAAAQLACEVGTSPATTASPSITVLRQYYFNLCRDTLLHSHFVPLLIDCGRNALAREHKRYPSAERNFEGDVEAFFFDDSSLFMATGGSPNLMGLGETSGWTSVRRIDALCSFLRQLWHQEERSSSTTELTVTPTPSVPNPNAASATNFSALAEIDGSSDDPPSTTRLGLAVFAKIKCFQRSVQLPERRFYSRVFLEPLALCVTACTWMLQHTHDTLLASLVASEFKAVVNYSMLDGDYELLRKMMFSMGDISVLKFVCDMVPPVHFAALLNSSPEFQRTPLHSSSMRLAIMAYFERMTSPHVMRGPDDGSAEAAAQMEITTLYANFYHFTALGETLHMEADDMLANFVDSAGGLLGADGIAVPQLTKKASWLGNLTGGSDKNSGGGGAGGSGLAVGNDSQQLELLKKQNRLLDEMEGQLSSAANFFVQDAMYQQCLACVRRLQLIGVQRRYLYLKVPILGRDLRNFKLGAVLAGAAGGGKGAESKASVLAVSTRSHRDSVMMGDEDAANNNFTRGMGASTVGFTMGSEGKAATFELIRQLLMSGASSSYQHNPAADHHPALVDPSDIFRCASGYDVTNSLIDLAMILHGHVVINSRRNVFAYYVEHTLNCSKALLDAVESMTTEEIAEQQLASTQGGKVSSSATAARKANLKWMQDVVLSEVGDASNCRVSTF